MTRTSQRATKEDSRIHSMANNTLRFLSLDQIKSVRANQINVFGPLIQTFIQSFTEPGVWSPDQ